MNTNFPFKPQLVPNVKTIINTPPVQKAAKTIKKLPPSVVKDIELKNHARRLASLSPIRIKVRHCISCSIKFESAGNRTCGCNTRSTGHIAGREIIY